MSIITVSDTNFCSGQGLEFVSYGRNWWNRSTKSVWGVRDHVTTPPETRHLHPSVSGLLPRLLLGPLVLRSVRGRERVVVHAEIPGRHSSEYSESCLEESTQNRSGGKVPTPLINSFDKFQWRLIYRNVRSTEDE